MHQQYMVHLADGFFVSVILSSVIIIFLSLRQEIDVLRCTTVPLDELVKRSAG